MTTIRPKRQKGMLAMSPQQAAVFNEPTRRDVMMLLAERAATVTQLAEALDKPKGTVGYHVKELEEAGLVAVVGTRKVRALTEKYYGRLARTYLFPRMDPIDELSQTFIAEAAEEMRPPREDETGLFTIRHARLPIGRVEEFAAEVIALAERFTTAPRGGDTVYGLIVGIYPTDRPSLREGK